MGSSASKPKRHVSFDLPPAPPSSRCNSIDNNRIQSSSTRQSRSSSRVRSRLNSTANSSSRPRRLSKTRDRSTDISPYNLNPNTTSGIPHSHTMPAVSTAAPSRRPSTRQHGLASTLSYTDRISSEIRPFDLATGNTTTVRANSGPGMNRQEAQQVVHRLVALQDTQTRLASLSSTISRFQKQYCQEPCHIGALMEEQGDEQSKLQLKWLTELDRQTGAMNTLARDAVLEAYDARNGGTGSRIDLGMEDEGGLVGRGVEATGITRTHNDTRAEMLRLERGMKVARADRQELVTEIREMRRRVKVDVGSAMDELADLKSALMRIGGREDSRIWERLRAKVEEMAEDVEMRIREVEKRGVEMDGRDFFWK